MVYLRHKALGTSAVHSVESDRAPAVSSRRPTLTHSVLSRPPLTASRRQAGGRPVLWRLFSFKCCSISQMTLQIREKKNSYHGSQEEVPQHVGTVSPPFQYRTSVHVSRTCTCIFVYLRVDPVSGENSSTHAH